MSGLTQPHRDSVASELLVHAYVDGELGAADALAVQREIASNPRLAAEAQNAIALQQALAEKFSPNSVPEHLRRRIDAAVGSTRRFSRPTWMALAASVVLAIALSSTTTSLLFRSAQSDRLLGQLVDRHMQRLVAGQTAEIASSDRHTVKPWFNGRLPYAPHVIDLAADGFPLVGGRIEVIGTELLPTLVYSRRLHVISVTEVPRSLSRSSTLFAPHSVNGFNSVTWTDGDLVYWAISDLNQRELEMFAKLFHAPS